jgi:hypothetical protein
MRFVVLTVAALVLASCASTDSGPSFAGYQSPYPKGSAVAVSPELEGDAIRSLKRYLRQQYGTEEFEILARESVGKMKEFIIDGKGRLVAGELHEIWTVKHSGRVVKHEFIMFPDGKRGNFVGFREIHEEPNQPAQPTPGS